MSLMNVIQKNLRKLAELQINHIVVFSIIIGLFTLFTFSFAFSVTLQSDLSKLDPQDIPVTQLRNKINTDFNQFESIVVLVEIDTDVESDIYDIRDPEVMIWSSDLYEKLNEEITIQQVTSIGEIFVDDHPQTIEDVKDEISNDPQLAQFFNSDYSWMVLLIDADVGGDNEKIQALNDRVNEIIKETQVPAGIKITTTGDAPLNSAIFTLLVNDAFFTLIFATILIFILLLILERSIKQGLIILSPLAIGLIWTIGTMGFLGIPITIATAAMGAMLLGLGVEYAIFMYSRYKEEKRSKSVYESLAEAISTVGATLVSSGTTTLIGFLALSLSLFPVLSDLGLTLAIGIFYMLLATIIVLPVAILLDENLTGKRDAEKEVSKTSSKKPYTTRMYESYGSFVAKRPVLVLVITTLITILMFYGMGQIKNQDVNFETILPEDLEEIKAYVKITDEVGDNNEVVIHVEITPEFSSSDEPQDIRDPRVMQYIDVLSKKARTVEHVTDVVSAADILRGINNGTLPQTIATQRQNFAFIQSMGLVNADYSATLIEVGLSEDALDDSEEVVRQIKEIVAFTESPAGVTARASGSLVVQSELDAQNQPDSQRTSLIALVGIVVFLYILTRSVKSTALPLLTVVLSIIWILGLTGFFRVPFNNITQSVLTMIIGIGIDFGLQVVNRFNQEVERHDKQTAMKETLANILTPMIITVLAAVIGFRAMGLGQLKVMADLGTLMSFGITASMIIAVSFVASITFLVTKGKKKPE